MSAVESALVLIGHSMGALILETAFLALLEDHSRSLALPSNHNSAPPVEITRTNQPVRFSDLILLLNSAADSRIAKKLIEVLRVQDPRFPAYPAQ